MLVSTVNGLSSEQVVADSNGVAVAAVAKSTTPSSSATSSSNNATAAIAATSGTNLPTVLALSPVIMPLCPHGNVLSSFNPLEFPGLTWGLLSAEQQALHPINLVFMNLAGVPSNERSGQITPCLDSWGVKRSTVKRIKKDYRVPPFPAMKTEVLVMRTNKDVFVVFRQGITGHWHSSIVHSKSKRSHTAASARG